MKDESERLLLFVRSRRSSSLFDFHASSFILHRSSFHPRVPGELNVMAALRHLNILQLDSFGKFLNAAATNRRRRIATANYPGRDEERNLVDQPGIEKLAGYIRSTFNQDTLNLASAELFQNRNE